MQSHPAHEKLFLFFVSIGLGFPCILVLVAGRKQVFTYLSSRLDNSQAMRIKDGAFMATLMDSNALSVGDTWWHQSSSCNADLLHSHKQYGDFKRTVVTEIREHEIVVLDESGMRHTVAFSHHTVPWEDLVRQGLNNLRCLDWLNMTSLMFQTSRTTTPELGRKIEACIDPDAIADGLRLLPVNIMHCKQVLILCGQTYASRLWCVWEICVLLSFVNVKVGLERIQCHSLCQNALEQLQNFDLGNAHCYDPNEEGKLRKVIEAVGSDLFVAKIRAVAQQLSEL